MREEVVKSPSVAFLLYGKRQKGRRPFGRPQGRPKGERQRPESKTWFGCSASMPRPAAQRPLGVPFLYPEEWSLSLQINSLQNKLLICAPIHGRVDDFGKNHHE